MHTVRTPDLKASRNKVRTRKPAHVLYIATIRVSKGVNVRSSEHADL